MISLMMPDINCCEMLDKIIEKKHAPYKETLLQQADLLKSMYEQYDVNLPPSMPEAISSIKGLLKSSYSNNNVVLREAKEIITRSLADNHRTKCPYCMINRFNTFDHYLPLSSYAAYAVYPPNLIPSCSECNSIKGERLFDDGGHRYFIHFYFDIIPEDQFLFFRLCFDGDNVPIISCFVEFSGEDSAGQIVESHFEALQLCEKYKKQADEKLSSVIDEYSGETLEDRTALVQKRWESLKRNFGANYWETALYEGILNSKDFLANLAS